MAALELHPKSSASTGSQTPLVLKATQLGLTGPEEWQDEALARGCFHYLQGTTPPRQRVRCEDFSNEELALVLLGDATEPLDPWRTRIGAMLLGAEENDVNRIARLAVPEGCAAVVRAIAEAALRYEPEVPFWSILLEKLPESQTPATMPHHSRFVSSPGLVGPRTHGKTVWLRPRKLKAFGYVL